MKRVRLAGIALTSLASLTVVATAAADREKVHLTKAGRAAASAVVLTRADLGSTATWTGGARKPDLSSSSPCPTFHPKQSDLVLIGAAETLWRSPGIQLVSEGQVLKTPRMVQLDWQRTVLAPKVLPCLRSAVVKGLSPAEKLVSFGPIATPKLAPYSRTYRALVDVTSAGAKARVLVDVLLVGRGRTEITLTTTAPFVAAQSVRTAELRLARLLLARVRM